MLTTCDDSAAGFLEAASMPTLWLGGHTAPEAVTSVVITFACSPEWVGELVLLVTDDSTAGLASSTPTTWSRGNTASNVAPISLTVLPWCFLLRS